MALIEDLKWRHATKAYDATKKVSEADISKIVEAMRVAPTSSGLQQFRLIVVDDQATKEALIPGSLNPDCIRDCSHVLVFAAWDKYTEDRIDTIYDKTTDDRGLPRGRFSRYTDMLKAELSTWTEQQQFDHAAKQAYIALGLALAQAAELKIDTTPAEGFDNKVIDEVLGLNDLGLKSCVLLYVGYRNVEQDWLAGMAKVRNTTENFALNLKKVK